MKEIASRAIAGKSCAICSMESIDYTQRGATMMGGHTVFTYCSALHVWDRMGAAHVFGVKIGRAVVGTKTRFGW